MPLPQLPDPRLDGEPASALDRASKPFLTVERLRLRLLEGQAFDYDVTTRAALDAVVIVAHFRKAGELHVVLRAAIRPPIWWRDRRASPWLWELPAGLVEPGESVRAAAARELFEEVGVRVEPSVFGALGHPVLPAPGMIAEVQTFFHAAIDWASRISPEGDASALESIAHLCALPLVEALALCTAGEIRDAKTELALRRLHEVMT